VETLSIGEVARRAGVSASAIRYYERAGLLAEPERVGGRRRYDPGVVRRLALIQAARRAGMSVSETHELLHGFAGETSASERWRALASGKLEEIDERIAHLRRIRELLEEALRCECGSLEECARLLSGERGDGPDHAGETGFTT